MDQPTGKVLVVDDEPHVVHIIQYKLEKAGFEVIAANNGLAGFAIACEQRPDLILTDFQMPGGDGLEMAKRLQEEPTTSDIPLIMLTARGHRAPLDELATTNVRSLLAKPFSPRELVSKVVELLRTTSTSEPQCEPGASAA